MKRPTDHSIISAHGERKNYMARLAFISTAHIHTQSFLEHLRDHDSAECVAVWDDAAERGRGYAERFGARFEPDLDAMLGDGGIDGFVICAENTRHLPLLEKALPAGRPVMCEKPLATRAEDAAAIARLIDTHGTALTCGYFHPFSASRRGLQQLLDGGALGKVTHARCRNAHHAAYGRWFDSPELAWFADPDLAGGGALMDMGTHAVHLLRRLLGPVESVWATVRNVSGQYEQVDDYGLIVMRFTDGALGQVESGWCFTGAPDGLEVVGREGSVWETRDGLVAAAPGKKPKPVQPGAALPDRIDRLIAVIDGTLTADEIAEDLAACLDAVTVMDAAYRSAASGGWEPVQRLG